MVQSSSSCLSGTGSQAKHLLQGTVTLPQGYLGDLMRVCWAWGGACMWRVGASFDTEGSMRFRPTRRPSNQQHNLLSHLHS